MVDEDDDEEPRERKRKQPSRGVSAALGAVRVIPPDACRRCNAKVSDETAEQCYVCNGVLCPDCSEQYGECGHRRGGQS